MLPWKFWQCLTGYSQCWKFNSLHFRWVPPRRKRVWWWRNYRKGWRRNWWGSWLIKPLTFQYGDAVRAILGVMTWDKSKALNNYFVKKWWEFWSCQSFHALAMKWEQAFCIWSFSSSRDSVWKPVGTSYLFATFLDSNSVPSKFVRITFIESCPKNRFVE